MNRFSIQIIDIFIRLHVFEEQRLYCKCMELCTSEFDQTRNRQNYFFSAFPNGNYTVMAFHTRNHELQNANHHSD